MEMKILELLEKNARYTTYDLATMLGVDESNVKMCIEELEKKQVICGYRALINWDKIENREIVTALIEVKVTPQRGEGFDKIAARIYKFDEVKSVYLMSGGFDLTVIVEGKTMKEVALFVGQKLAALDAVLSTGTHFVLKKYKDNGILLEGMKKDERMLISP
ncbi:MAG: Lrp/AsnC family transcriptional regulator [Cellulosilyticaceae bacterium]